MSSLNPRIEAIFHETMEHAPAERETFVAKACAGDESLQHEVQRLLAAHEDAGTYFERSNSPEIEAELARLKPEEEGERIGRYKLLQEIGQGGFGVVWMAEQMEPVSRRVALKIIKAGMDTREVIARFEAERQALAMMDHPNIAKVFDAGATQLGRPFFVMELVKGLPITKFCDEQEFTTRQRLELFADVCSAINHAHQKGVIHRDIKPSNVMVTLNGDRPVVKVIDFGIAKATQGRLTDKTLFTRLEEFIGTPAYMSPEQAALSEVDIDTRSDIYGLGILLYELLTGKPPFDAKSLLSAGYEEMRRIIREVEPVKPSSRLGTSVGEERTTLAKVRRVAPEKLDRLVEPDLDWIVMKAIEKDRTRRYETANGLALDIQRFLNDEPVSAGPPRAAYRFRKFARRNKAVLRAVALVLAVLLGGIATATTLYLREREALARESAQRLRAENSEKMAQQKANDEKLARKEAEAMYDFVVGVLASPQPMRRGSQITVVESLTEALPKARTQLREFPEARHNVQSAIVWVMFSLDRTKEVISYAEESRAYYAETRLPNDLRRLRAEHLVGMCYMGLKRWEEAKILFERMYPIEKTILTPEHPEAGELSQLMGNLSACYSALGLKEQALALREETMDYCRRRKVGDDHLHVIRTKEGLASSYFAMERWADALKLREELLVYRYRSFKPENSGPLLTALENVAQSYFSVGREADAQRVRAEAHKLRQSEVSSSGAPQADFIIAKQKIAKALGARQFDEAVQSCRELVKLMPEALVTSGKEVAPEARLANALLLSARFDQARQPEEALQARREADELLQTLLTKPTDVIIGMDQADLFAAHGNWKEAALLCRQLNKAFPGNPWPAFRLGPLLIESGEIEAFEKHCRELLLPFTSAEPDKLDSLLRSLETSHRGHILDVIAKTVCLRPSTDAELKWAVLLAERATNVEKDPSHYWYVFTRGLAAYRGGNHDSAVSLLEEAIPHLSPSGQAGAQTLLAMVRARQGKADLARLVLQNSIRLHDSNWFSPNRIALEGNPVDWLIAHILLREARSLIDKAK